MRFMILVKASNDSEAGALPDEDIDRIKRSIEIQLTEYADAIEAATSWWQRCKPSGFRCKRYAPTARGYGNTQHDEKYDKR